MATDIEWAWAAGLFEGEGSIAIPSDPSKHRAVIMSVGMTDEDVVRKFHAVVGVGGVHGPSKPKRAEWSPAWVWASGKQNDVKFVIERFLPFLGKRRFRRVHEALEYIKHNFKYPDLASYLRSEAHTAALAKGRAVKARNDELRKLEMVG